MMIDRVEAAVKLGTLVKTMVDSLVDSSNKTEVEVISQGDNFGLVVMVKVAVEDLGKVIGVKGRTARSLRTIVAGASRKIGLQVSLNIARPEVGSERITLV